jgi:hypothetical protein
MIFLFLTRSNHDNIDKDFIFAAALRRSSFDIKLFYISQDYYKDGYDDQDISVLCKKYKLTCHKVDDQAMFLSILDKNMPKLIVFSQNRILKKLIPICKILNIKTITYSSYASCDHLYCGEDFMFVRSEFIKKHNYNIYRHLRKKNMQKTIKVTGCLSKLNTNDIKINNKFSKNNSSKIVGFHPKDIDLFSLRVKTWFKFRTKIWRNNYVEKLDALYQNISTELQVRGYNVFETSHPSATHINDSRYGNELISQQHKNELIMKSNFGISVTSSISMEYAYYKKPFLFVDSQSVYRPKYKSWNYKKAIEQASTIDNIDKRNLWVPNWVGEYLHQADQLHLVEGSLCNNLYDFTETNNIYWSGISSEEAMHRIILNIKDIYNENL